MNNIPLGLVRASEVEYALLANKIGMVAFSNSLTLSNNILVGWRSNKYAYVLPEAYKVATGQYPNNFHSSDYE